MKEIHKLAMENSSEVIELRRDIHKHPEIGRKEFRTADLIRSKLEEYGVDQIDSPVPTAVIALIHGNKGEGKCVALRADIDALPVEEETGLPYSSEVPGMMHACGHDMHVAMLLGVAKILCQRREEFAGTVKLIFQHSEDTMPGGAKELVEKGALENPQVDAIFGMHVYPDEDKVGKIGIHAGPLTTSVDIYNITVKGKGGHGSEPHTTKDPILAACEMVTLLQQIPSRYINPLETVVFPICTIQGGEAVNVIPSEAKFSGVARTYNNAVRGQIKEQVTQIAEGVGTLSGCKVEVDHVVGYPACYNDKALIETAETAIEEVLGKDAIVQLEEPKAFSEDFSYFTEMSDVPGAYLLLFAGHEGDLVSLHNPKCAMKEEAMPAGVAVMTGTALKFLQG